MFGSLKRPLPLQLDVNPGPEMFVQTAISLMQQKGYGNTTPFVDNSTFEAKRHLEKSTREAALLWHKIHNIDKTQVKKEPTTEIQPVPDLKASTTWLLVNERLISQTLGKQDCVKAIWNYLTENGCIKDSGYLRKLTEEHINHLFDMYVRPPKQEIDFVNFCHMFLYLNRENVLHESHEVSLAQAIDSSYQFVQESKSFSTKSRSEIAEELKAANLRGEKEVVIFRLAEGRAEVSSQQLTTYGLNIEICCLNSKGQPVYARYLCDTVVGDWNPTLDHCFMPSIIQELQSNGTTTNVFGGSWPRRFASKLTYDPAESIIPKLAEVLSSPIPLLGEYFGRFLLMLIENYYYPSYSEQFDLVLKFDNRQTCIIGKILSAPPASGVAIAPAVVNAAQFPQSLTRSMHAGNRLEESPDDPTLSVVARPPR